MRALLLAAFGISLVPPAAIADGLNLAGSLGRCTRSSDQSQFVITFYPGGGVGGGELQNREVIPTVAEVHALTQSRRPMDMMVQGCSTSLFQAAQQ